MPYKNPEDDKACRLRNRHNKLAYMKKYRLSHLDRERARCKQWYADNKEKAISDSKQYFKDKPHVHKAAKRKYLAKKRADPKWNARQALNSKNWREKNPEYQKEYAKRRYETDANYLIKCRLRSRLTKKLKCQKAHKTTNTMALTGCTPEFLRGYLEAQFKPGMTWKTVHVDHHVPLAEFDLRDPEQQKQAFHYSNLRILWAVDNMRKGKKHPDRQPELS